LLVVHDTKILELFIGDCVGNSSREQIMIGKSFKRSIVAGATLAASMAVGSAAFASEVIQLTLVPTSGPTIGPINVLSLSGGVVPSVQIGSASGGAGAGKATLDPITFKKPLDSNSPLLFKVAATGGHYKSATFTFLRVTDGAQTIFFTITLKEVFITSYAFADAEGRTTAADIETVGLVGLQEVLSEPPTGTIGCYDLQTGAAC
jgi:type VI protein secretion system component Hcp